jgi:hypothetical protein
VENREKTNYDLHAPKLTTGNIKKDFRVLE